MSEYCSCVSVCLVLFANRENVSQLQACLPGTFSGVLFWPTCGLNFPTLIESMETIGTSCQSLKKKLQQAGTNYKDKNECLLNLTALLVEVQKQKNECNKVPDSLDLSDYHAELRSVINLLRDYSHYQDPRVRGTALSSLVKDSSSSLFSLVNLKTLYL